MFYFINLAFPSRKIESLINESDKISIFSNKGWWNINLYCWLNSCLQVVLGTVLKEFLLRPEFENFSVCQYLKLRYRYLNSTERNSKNFLQMKEVVKLLREHLQVITPKRYTAGLSGILWYWYSIKLYDILWYSVITIIVLLTFYEVAIYLKYCTPHLPWKKWKCSKNWMFLKAYAVESGICFFTRRKG